MDELVDTYTVDGTFIKSVTRDEAYRDGLIHAVSHGFLINSNHQILIQQRAHTKATWPDFYDLSFAETGQAGESFEQITQRGLHEELGVQAQIQLLPDVQIASEKIGEYDIRVRYKIAYVFYDGPIHIDPVEVQTYEYKTIDQIDALIENPDKLTTPWLKTDWEYAKTHLLKIISQ